MRKSVIFDKCVDQIQRLLIERKLYIRSPYRCKAQHYFAVERNIHSAIVVSTAEGAAGIITRAWGVVFADTDKIIRCTEVHNSFYGESVVLGKLLKELDDIALNT